MPDKDELAKVDLSAGGQRRIYRGRKPTRGEKDARYNRYKEWMSSDFAEYASETMPLRDRGGGPGRGVKALRIMKNRVLAYQAEHGVSREEAIQQVTTQLVRDVRNKTEADWRIAQLIYA